VAFEQAAKEFFRDGWRITDWQGSNQPGRYPIPAIMPSVTDEMGYDAGHEPYRAEMVLQTASGIVNQLRPIVPALADMIQQVATEKLNDKLWRAGRALPGWGLPGPPPEEIAITAAWGGPGAVVHRPQLKEIIDEATNRLEGFTPSTAWRYVNQAYWGTDSYGDEIWEPDLMGSDWTLDNVGKSGRPGGAAWHLGAYFPRTEDFQLVTTPASPMGIMFNFDDPDKMLNPLLSGRYREGKLSYSESKLEMIKQEGSVRAAERAAQKEELRKGIESGEFRFDWTEQRKDTQVLPGYSGTVIW
jgi:hypothetical protein